MALLCARCGAEVPAGAQFCAACGTAVAPAAATSSSAAPQAGAGYEPVSVPGQPAGGAPPAPSYSAVPPSLPPAGGGYAPPPPPPMGYQVPAGVAPRGGGGSAIKIILIVVLILVGLGILGAGAIGFMVWRVAHAIHVANRSGQLTLNTPSGSIIAGSGDNLTPDELGTEIYPGAQSTKGGMRMNLPTGSIISAVYLSSDSKDQVLSFYKDKLGSEASVFDNANSAMITKKKGPHETVMVTISVRAGEDEGKTKIAIVHTRNKGAS